MCILGERRSEKMGTNDNDENQVEMYKKQGTRPLKEVMESYVFDDDKLHEVLTEITRNVATYIELMGISIEELSAKTGLSKGTFYKMLGGKAVTGLRALIKISYVLQVPLNKFIPIETKNLQRKTLGNRIDDLCINSSPKIKNLIFNVSKMIVENEKSNMTKK